MPGTPTALSFMGDYDQLLTSYRDLANIPINTSLPYNYLAQYQDQYVDDTTLKPSLAFYVIGDAVTEHFAFMLWRSLSKI